MTTFATTVVVAVLATAWAVASPLAVQCASAAEFALISPAPSESAGFVDSINQLRLSQGLNALTVDANLTDVAQGWAEQMAEAGGISHRLDLRAGITALWKTIGENVGVGPSVASLMDAFIASPAHYKNLIDPRFTHIGVGSVRTSGGLLYTSHEFMAAAAGSGSVVTAPPATTPATVRAPRVTTPRVTTPATTPVTAPPTTVTTQPEATVTSVLLPAEEHELQDSSQNNHKQQDYKSNGRCRSHQSSTLMALPAASIIR